MKAKLRKINCLIYDFDGVMTDNKVLVFSDGTEAVWCNRADGLAVSQFKKAGFRQCIISTEANPVVGRRAEKLGIPCIQGSRDKAAALTNYARKNSIDLNLTAYIGNDLNDLEAMELVGYKVAPKDSVKEVLAIADLITRSKGGQGVLYELFKEWLKNKR